MIRPASRPFIDAARTDDARLADADRAVAALRADVERWSRWGLGLLGFLAAVVGIFFGIGTIETARMLGGSPDPIDLIAIAIAAIIGLGGIALLLALWWSGHRIIGAASWWMRLPYTRGGRQRRAGGWIAARAVNFEPRVLVRLISSALAFLVAVSGIALYFRDLTEQITSMTAVFGCIGVLALLAMAGQLGGVLRLVSGLGEADPLWVRLRSALLGR